MLPFRGFGDSDDPWFRVGQIAVTTTLIVSAMSVAYMFVWAFEGPSRPITRKLALNSGPFFDGVSDGQIWRLITWPLPVRPTLWTLLLVAVFWMLGSQLEALMGRARFTVFLLLLTVVPASLMTLLELMNVYGIAYGLRYVELGVLVAFAVQYSNVRFWPGIPAWALAGIIVGMAILQSISSRSQYDLFFTMIVAALAPLLLRAFGFADQHEWLPRFPLPTKLGGNPYRRADKKRRKQQQSKRFGGGDGGGEGSGDGGGDGSRGGSRLGGRGARSASSQLSSVPPPPPPAEVAAQVRIDALLDKMSEHGWESLTESERRDLEVLSKRLRDKRDRN